MKRFALSVFTLLLAILPAVVTAQEPHGTGYIPSPFAKQLKSASHAKHGEMLKKLAEAPLPESYESPHQIPQQNQGSCGSCWDVSGCIAVACAHIKAGNAKGDGSFVMSADTVMWCYSTGGCNGDDASTVMRIAKNDGLPINADVGPYQATGRGPCNKTAKRYKISESGDADANNDGVATYEEIKSAVYNFGVCVITVNAGGLVNGEQVSTSRGGGTNHQIVVVGWDDTKKGNGYDGALLCKNQWGQWGFQHAPPGATAPQYGYTWLGNLTSGHIAASGSSEVLWCKAESVAPPFTAPLSLFDPSGKNLSENTYPDLASAEAAAHQFADKDKILVTIKDDAGEVVETIAPTPPTPPHVTFTIPAYSFTVANGRWGSQTVTIPARTITAPISEVPPVPVKTVPSAPQQSCPTGSKSCSVGSVQSTSSGCSSCAQSVQYQQHPVQKQQRKAILPWRR